MATIEEGLEAGEFYAYGGTLHPIRYLGAWLFVAAGILSLVLRYSRPIAGGCLGLAALWAAFVWFAEKRTRIVVTNRRLVAEIWGLRRRQLNLQLPQIKLMDSTQGLLLGNYFDYGTLILTLEDGTVHMINTMRSPKSMRRRISEQRALLLGSVPRGVLFTADGPLSP